MNFKTNNLLLLIGVFAISSLLFSSCKEDETPVVDPTDCVEHTGNITSDETWSADRCHVMIGRIIVTAGATLTIEPGALVQGRAGTNANAAVLMIATDGTINAAGTAANPIIFTSEADNIEPGQLTGTNLTETDNGLWGGVIILGEAPISPGTGTTDRIEGIPADVAEAVYGGSDAADNSGTFTYVSIRHGGVALEPDKEINGLTLGGVGSGTTINHVEVVANFDDGIELFGGTVNIDDAIVMYQGDDAFDIDQAYAGTVNNYIYVGGATSDNGLEIDGPEGSENAAGTFTMQNGSLKGPGDDFASLRSAAQGVIKTSYFFDFPADAAVVIGGNDAFTNVQNDVLQIENCQFNTNGLIEDVSVTSDVSTTDAENILDSKFTTNTVSATATVGADKSAFTGWTYADATDALADF